MKTKQFRIGRLATLGQVIKALGKTIRAMSDGSLDSQVGARICNGLGIMRACLETQKLEQLEVRMSEISRIVGARTVVSSPLSIDHKTPLSINHETNGSGSLQARVGHGHQLLRLTLERKRLIIRQSVRNAGKISWENGRAASRHQPL